MAQSLAQTGVRPGPDSLISLALEFSLRSSICRLLLPIALVLVAQPAAGRAQSLPAEEAPEDSVGEYLGLQPPEMLIDLPPVPIKANETPGLGSNGLPIVRRIRAEASVGLNTTGHGGQGGALAGKTVYVSAGHGWAYSADAWRTQRGNTNGIVEDFVSAEAVNQLLLQYLVNMGAHVVTVRETDMSSERVIVDDESPDFTIDNSATTLDQGFAVVPLPITDAVNPFQAGSSKLLSTESAVSARATWTFDVPRTGDYNVYAGWVQAPNRASDAHYIVQHGGGETHFRVDQRRHGSTWVLLGRFHFRQGDPVDQRSLQLVNDSQTPGATISADVARIGGGMGMMSRGGGTNGRPMYEHAARYYTQWAGAPASVWDSSTTDHNDDVGSRSRFAAWDHEDGEDAVYVAWHTNAPNPGQGTESYAYGPSAPPGPLSEFTGVPGSLQLVDAIHTTLVAALRSEWDPSWRDRGQHTAYFGELNPKHNSEIPSTLIEVAFHATPSDAEALLEPRFRHIAARAMAQGVAKYFSKRDGTSFIAPPIAPPVLSAVNAGKGILRVCWQAPETSSVAGLATGYRLYASKDGRAFDDGFPVVETCTELEQYAPGESVYFRVSATNVGGESMPSELVGARVAASGKAAVLIINGFQRLDGRMSLTHDLSAFGLGSVKRGFLAQMNDGSHLARHGQAMAAASVSFDGSSADAIATPVGPVLGDYTMVDWYLGEESSNNDPISSAERSRIEEFLASGGKLLLSGSEIGWSLVEAGTTETEAFFSDVLRAEYVSDDANTYLVSGALAPFTGLAMSFDDMGEGSYDADYPDVFAPLGGAEIAFYYEGGSQGAALRFRDEATGGTLLLLGFPFETILGAEVRADLMVRILGDFGIEADAIGPGDDDDDDDDPDDPTDAIGGCGCQLGTAPTAPATWLLFGVIFLVLRRRRDSV